MKKKKCDLVDIDMYFYLLSASFFRQSTKSVKFFTGLCKTIH